MRVVMILNQIQAGIGTKSEVNTPLVATKDMLGPAVTMRPVMAKYEEYLGVIIYLGSGTYEDNKVEVTRKIKGMLERVKADAVILGPCFDYADYSKMSCELALDIQSNTNIIPVVAMAKEMDELIAEYKEKITIVKMPKKGESGLNNSLENIAKTLQKMGDNSDRSTFAEWVY